MIYRGILVLVLTLFMTEDSGSQTYPIWFLNQYAVKCGMTAIGYANPSFYPDSAAAYAFRDGYQTFVQQREIKVSGGQAFWSTEGGTFWMGDNFQEQFDTTAVIFRTIPLHGLDTLITADFVAVILGNERCSLSKALCKRQPLNKRLTPRWIESPPRDARYYYAVGTAPQYHYEASSWLEAEQQGFLNLARTVYVDLKALQKVSTGGQEIRHEELSVTLINVQPIARWRDLKERIFYVLVRMPK